MKFDLVIAGYNVVNTETKGAAQRGGSVLSHVRVADGEIYSPLVPTGQADVLLGFEPLEAMRYINLLSGSGCFIINNAPIPTILANMKVDEYPSPEQMRAAIEDKGLKGCFLGATQAAKELGNILLTNVVMLGAFTAVSDLLAADVVLAQLLSQVDEKYHKDDIAAFKKGRELVMKG